MSPLDLPPHGFVRPMGFLVLTLCGQSPSRGVGLNQESATHSAVLEATSLKL